MHKKTEKLIYFFCTFGAVNGGGIPDCIVCLVVFAWPWSASWAAPQPPRSRSPGPTRPSLQQNVLLSFISLVEGPLLSLSPPPPP